LVAFDTRQDESDETLLDAFAAGDQAAARALMMRLTPRCLSVAFRMLRDRAEAEDVAQEAMLRLWKTAPDWEKGRAKVSTWLYRVTLNLCTDRLRKSRRTSLGEVPEQMDDAAPVDQEMERTERAEALHDALEKLPERQRVAVMLRHLEDMSNPAIAEIMETSTEAVESLLSRGRRQLAALLAGQKSALGLDG
jgi:RNA polymerase sigma-70 factor (ECF subfamily)